MNRPATRAMPPNLELPDAPAVVAGHGYAAILTADGELITGGVETITARLRTLPAPILVHAPATFSRLGLRALPAYDLLDLFAFALPATTAAPTPRGLALILDIDPPGVTLESAAAMLPAIAHALLRRLAAARDLPRNRDAAALAARMGQAGWGWAPFVTAALGRQDAAPAAEAAKVWRRLPEWEDAAPPPPPAAHPVSEADARTRLARMLGPAAEQRPGQSDYAGAAAAAFAPRERRGDPHLVLAEAGTGTGKTLGYLAPASVWAERNGGAVWISTFTRHLQRQIYAELGRLFADPEERRRRVVVRKGRENYLCLLNLEDAVAAASGGIAPASIVLLGLVARWALATADGDVMGGDIPGWLGELFGAGALSALAGPARRVHPCRLPALATLLRRTYGSPRPYGRSGGRQPRTLVMAQAAWGGLDDASVPTRYVFDEGHHVFDAADSAFSATVWRRSGGAAALAAGRGGRTLASARPAPPAG